MLPYKADLRIILCSIGRVSILQGVPIRVIDVLVAVRNIVHEERPEEITRDDGIRRVLARLNDVEE